MVTVHGIGAMTGTGQANPQKRDFVMHLSDFGEIGNLYLRRLGHFVNFNLRVGTRTQMPDGTQIATIPEGYRPMAKTVLSSLQGSQEYAIITIEPDGRVLVSGGLYYGTSYTTYWTFDTFYITNDNEP